MGLPAVASDDNLVDVSNIFYFSARGKGKGSPRRQEGWGVGFLLKIPRGGGGSSRRRGGAKGQKGVAGNLGGGGG